MPSNTMPTLALSYQVALEGIFPPSAGGGGSGEWYLGAIRTFAGNFEVRGHAFAQGQILSIAQNTALFALYGTTYGGNGQTTFALPNFAGDLYRGVGQLPGGGNYDLGLESGNDLANFLQLNLPGAAGGTAQAVSNVETSLAARYCINVEGIPGGGNTAVNILGAVTQFAGSFAPGGTVDCDGRLLQISTNQNLFALLGTTYGGDGITTFAVPDLRGRAPIGIGQGPGLTNNVQLGQMGGSENIVLTNANLPVAMGGQAVPVDNRSPYLGLTPLIAIQGIFPSRNAQLVIPNAAEPTPIEFQPDFSTIGEIIWFAGNFAPPGWAIAQGQILSIAQNTALFSILGTTYGGNGQTTFALPDLRGRAISGFNNNTGFVLGAQEGTETFTLTMSDIPSLNISGTVAGETFYGGDLADRIVGGNGPDTLNGNGGADVLNGDGGDDTINGGNGADLIDGGSGVDQMTGGPGDDSFVVDNAGDNVFESVGGGSDRVYAKVSYVLTAGSEVERMSTADHAGTAAINLTGNALAQIIFGNAGNNVIDGGGGGDELVGQGGDDSYYVSAGDIVTEYAGGGNDRVYARTDYALWSTREIETLSTDNDAATVARTLIGNELNQTIIGNAGANVLDGGGGGGDTLRGLGGDDWYRVRTGDVIEEASNGGSDRLFAFNSYVLNAGASVELMSTTDHGGTGAINLTGNELSQTIYGNAGNNTINGGLGADILLGFGGANTFAFTTALGGGNIDRILDFVSGTDKIALDDAIFTGLSTGALPVTAFVLGTTALDGDDRILYDVTNGRLYFDADGNGAGAAVQFATLNAGQLITANDFTVI